MYPMTVDEVSESLKCLGEVGEFLYSLYLSEKIKGKHPEIHINMGKCYFMRKNRDGKLDEILCEIDINSNNTYEVTFYIVKNYNLQLRNYIIKYRLESNENAERFKYDSEHGVFHNLRVYFENFDELKKFMLLTFVQADIMW